ncbi:transcriptional repressor NrdR [Clostridia bacterium]|nr:transcriptional repressor NrdR [Clostridia bacterium]
MKCPVCGTPDSRVIETRAETDDLSIKRRRECISCHNRFTTYEAVETIPVVVIKKDHSRESFDRSKVLRGIIKACEKRPITEEQMKSAAAEIETAIQNKLPGEISSSEIGELVMEKLKTVDEVAYVRFASVYREFKDINTFLEELKVLIKRNNPKKSSRK